MFKVVDTEYGYESHRRHNTEEQAEEELDRDYMEFLQNKVSGNFNKTVVSEEYVWCLKTRKWIKNENRKK